MDFKIYTSGATKYVSPEDSYSWRKEAKNYLEKFDSDYRVKVFIPEEYFNYHTLTPLTQKQCQQYFLKKVESSDLMLVNLNGSNKSIGTGKETERAVIKGIPIIGFGEDDVYPWIYNDCDVVMSTLEQALSYIRYYYLCS
ncbi:hypothetical protein [Ruminococcus sp.]|uniref:hypothetical protein n=1 Tax=Ruminococcus sp. TaxID=41978 RepID=UPI0025FBB1CF|nr:hypothetical protein [Ruminococcus sp.]